MLVGGTVFDRGDVLRYAFGKGFCWFLRCAVTLHPSMHTARGFPETFLVYGVVGDDWQHFFYALFRYSSSAENRIFCKMVLKCCYCQVALRAVGSQRGWKICSTLLLFSWFERPNVAPHATLSVAPPRSRVPFFRCSLAADTVILPCFRFRKEILGSAVEGTPKGVQKRYARLSNLLYGFHVTNYVSGSHPQKTYFSHSC